MTFWVAVFGLAGEPEAANLAALTEACSEIVAPERCQVSDAEVSDAEGSDAGVPDAKVRFLGENEVVVETAGTEAKKSRQIRFQPSDLARERWRSLGLLVGSLLRPRPSDEQGSSQTTPGSASTTSSADASNPQEASLRRTDKPDPNPRQATMAWRLGAAGLAGPGLTHGPYGYGGRLAVELVVSPWISGLAKLRASTAPRDAQGIGASWIGGGLGAGHRFDLGSYLSLSLDAGLAYEELLVDLSATASQPSESGARGYLAFWVGLANQIRLAKRLELEIGVEALTSPGQGISVENREVGRNPKVRPALTLGLGFGPF